MSIDFPSSPVDGQIFLASNSVTYVWQAAPGVWRTQPSIDSVTGTGRFVLWSSPEMIGVPTAPTPALVSDDGTLATTAFVNAAIAAALP